MGPVLLIIGVFLLFLAVMLAFGQWARIIARGKGRGEGTWFLLGGVFGIFGVLVLLTLPPGER